MSLALPWHRSNVQERQEREADEDQEDGGERLERGQRSTEGNGMRHTEVIGYLSKASSTNFIVGATTLSSNLQPGVIGLVKVGRKPRDLAYFLKASVTDCTLTSNCGQSSSSWSKGAAILVMEVVRLS